MNLPDLHELTEKIRIENNDPFKDIELVLKQQNGRITYPYKELDLEIFLTILDSLVDPLNAIPELGPFATYLYNLLENKKVIDKLKTQKEKVQDLKQKSLELITQALKNHDNNEAKKLYDELFSVGNLNNEIKNAQGTVAYNIFDYIATTNYDLVIESYARNHPTRSIYLDNRGFKPIEGEKATQYLDLRFLRENVRSINYLKLHGSLDWWERDDKKIVLSTGESMYGGKLIDHIMIYPIYEKYISLEPFYSLYTAFRKTLCNETIVIVIGYSFRDISINNALLDHLRTTEDSRLIISVKSSPVKQRITRIFGKNKRISLVNKYFGERGFVNALKHELRRNITKK